MLAMLVVMMLVALVTVVTLVLVLKPEHFKFRAHFLRWLSVEMEISARTPPKTAARTPAK
jgi:hypothetical protein